MVTALLDTGAAKTLMSEDLARRLRVRMQSLDNSDDTKMLFTADGGRMPLQNKSVVRIQINEITVDKEVYIVRRLSHQFIVGTDFLQQTAALCDFGRRVVTFNDSVNELSIHNNMRECWCEPEAVARAVYTCCVPAFSELLCLVSIPPRFNGDSVLLEPHAKFQYQPFACARAIVKCKNGKAVCKVMNFSPRDLTLHKNKQIATIERLGTIASCAPFEEPDSKEVGLDIVVTESEKTLDDFHKEYKFKINPELTVTQKYELLQLLYNHRPAFARNLNEIGLYPHYEMKLEARDPRPAYTRQFRVPKEDALEIERQIQEFYKANIIEKAEDVNYNSPVFLVNKKNGQKRLVVDLRVVNDRLLPQVVVLPRITELVDEIALQKSEYISSIDLFSGFYQIKIHKDSRKFVSFTSPLTGQRYSYRRSTMGSLNSPCALLTIMNELFRGQGERSRFYCYMDDVVILGSKWKYHMKNLHDLFEILQTNNMNCNPAKCDFSFSQIEYLGHTISKNGIQISRSKFKVINKLAPPKNKKSLQRLIGMVTYWRRFVRGFSQHTSHMRALLRSDAPFNWTPECQAELDYLKEKLIADPILQPLDPNKDVTILCDASYDGLGYVVLQEGPDKLLHPNFYGGNALSESQKHYCPADLELAALVLAMRAIEWMAHHHKTTVYTDNVRLLYFHKWSPLTQRQKRIVAYLQQFRLELRFIRGCKNTPADFLSRCYEDMPDSDRVELMQQVDNEEFIVSASKKPSENIIRGALQTASETAAKSLQTDEKETQSNLLQLPSAMDACTQTDRGERETRERDEDDDDEITRCKARMDGPTAAAVITRAQARTAGADNKTATVEIAEENRPTVRAGKLSSRDSETNENAHTINSRETADDALQAAVGTADRTGLIAHNSGVQQETLESAEPYEKSCDISDDAGQTSTDMPADFNDEQRQVTQMETTIDNEEESEDEEDADKNAERLGQAAMEALQTAQQALTANDYLTDSEFSNMYRYLQTGDLSGDDKVDKKTLLVCELYVLKGEQLYKLKLPKTKKDVGLALDRLCVPKAYRAALLFRFHDIVSHGGIQKTYLSLSARFFWQSMFSDVVSYIRTCCLCQTSKRNYNYRATPLNPLEVPDRPFINYALDFKTLPRKTAEGNTAILCIVEIFSGWPFLIPCPDMSALTTAKMIVKYVVAQFGLMKVINSDRGSNFTAKLFRYITKMFNTEQRISASRTPKSNGAAEALVQRVSEMIRRFDADDLEIEACLPMIELSLRASSLSRMHFSPYEILYGRSMHIGDGMSNDSPIPFDGEMKCYISTLRRELRNIHENVRQRKLEIKQEEQAAYNKRNRVAAPTWKVGQRVLLEDRAVKPNSNVVLTKRPFRGPYLITDIIKGPGYGASYRLIEVSSGRTHRYLVSSERLKAYDDNRAELDINLPGVENQPCYEPKPITDSESEYEDAVESLEPDDVDNNQEAQPEIPSSQTLPSSKFEPALKITQERIRNKRPEYLVTFVDGSQYWAYDVSQGLLLAWRLTQQARRARKSKAKQRKKIR